MYTSVKTNPVFLPCEDQAQKYKPLVASGPPHYRPNVMIHDWQLRKLAEPRDNKSGNFRCSTYKRLGADEDPIGISATRAMTEQIRSKSDYDTEYRYRSMLNFYSLPITETNEWEKASKFADLDLPKPIEPTDYRTTLRDDYPWHYPSKTPQPEPIPDVPWMLYRRILGYNSHDLARRPGISKFLDDNTDIQNRAAALKMPRFVSYDPMMQEYTDTKRFSDAILKNLDLNCSE